MPDTWTIELFGGLRVRRGERVWARFRTRRAAALLAYLALNADRPRDRDAVVFAIWPDAPLEAGRARLRQELAALRRDLDESPDAPLIDADRRTLRLVPGAFETDVARFEALARQDDPDARREAADLYRGPLLRDFHDEWTLGERERLALLCGALLRRVQADDEARGALDDARAAALRRVQLDPFGEEPHADLLRLLERPEALRRGRAFVETLARELGAQPSAAFLAQLAALERDAPPAPAPARPRPGIAAPLTRFFGRDDARRWLHAALDDGARLITLTGPGGIGKTRLALTLAREREAGGAQVVFVPLADVVDPALVPSAVAAALAQTPRPGQEAAALVEDALGALPNPLLVLDNLEPLLPDAAATVRRWMERLPHLICLVTSRRPLGIHGEREYPLGPLADNDSRALFVDRARAARPDFALTPGNADAVAELCRRLDGIPLGLELAAAWARALTPEQLLQRLEKRLDALVSHAADAPERHRSLAAAIETSWRGLDDDARRFLARLSVFRGGWSLEAAEALVEPSGDALDLLVRLRDRSLVSVAESGGAMRWRLLAPLRAFAQERLDRGDARIARLRHAAYFVAFAQDQAGDPGQADGGAFDRLERERDNLRAAHEYALADGGDSALALRLGVALRDFYAVRGHLAEGRATLAAALARDGAPKLMGDASHAAGFLARIAGDLPAAQTLQEQALTLYQSAGDDRGVSTALNNLGVMARIQGDPITARRYEEESLAIRRRLGDRRLVANTLNNLGIVARVVGDFAAARAYLNESLQLYRAAQAPGGGGAALINLGWTELDAGNLTAARCWLGEALRFYTDMNSRVAFAEIFEALGGVLAADGAPENAARLWGAAERLRDELGAPLSPADRQEHDARIAPARAADPTAFDAAWAQGRAESLERTLARATDAAL